MGYSVVITPNVRHQLSREFERLRRRPLRLYAIVCVSQLQVRKENQQNRIQEGEREGGRGLRELARCICKGRNFPKSQPYRALTCNFRIRK